MSGQPKAGAKYMRDSYVMIDPHHPDALPFISAMELTFGWMPICIYTNPKLRFYHEQDWPVVRRTPLEMAESIVFEDGNTEALIADLKTRYNIRAVVPWDESLVTPAAEMLRFLDIDWMTGEQLGLFRDKFRMKSVIAEREPSIRLPYTRIVRTVDDVFSEQPPERFVIKPNDGMGSLHLGFFGRSERQGVADHLSANPDLVFLLEELIDGPEFRINGIVRRDGTVVPLLVTEYVPRQHGETAWLCYAMDSQLRTTDPRWDMLVAYAKSVIDATELRGSLFHIEVKVDGRGPALIDFGARPPSDGGAYAMSILHPDWPDVYSVAVRDMVGANSFAMAPPDYEFHDAGCLVHVSGMTDQDGLVTAVSGYDEIEAMPEFIRWIVRTEPGDTISPTIDLRTITYLAVFRHDGVLEQSEALHEHVQKTVTYEVDPNPKPWTLARLRTDVERARRKTTYAARERMNR